MPLLRFRFRADLVAVMLFATYSLTAAAANPEEPGPYPVGVTTIQLVDSSRTDPELNAPRPLLAEIWYPATDKAKGVEPTTFSDFYMGGENPQMNLILTMAFKFDVTKIDETFKTVAVRDAATAKGSFPLLIFSHGNGGMRSQSTFWCDHMASHGYIVAAVDHTGNACATSYEGKVIPYRQDTRTQAAEDRPKDVSFLIDEMTRMNETPDSRFYQRIDLEYVGAAGHSFGGYTAIAANLQDPRIDAIAPMAAVVPEFAKASTKPLLLIVATEDDTIDERGNAGARNYYEATKAEKYLVEVKNAGHYSFSDMYQINPAWGDGIGSGRRITDGSDIEYIDMESAYRIVNGYSTAFFDRHLKNSKVHEDYLGKNNHEDEVLYRTSK